MSANQRPVERLWTVACSEWPCAPHEMRIALLFSAHDTQEFLLRVRQQFLLGDKAFCLRGRGLSITCADADADLSADEAGVLGAGEWSPDGEALHLTLVS